MTARNLTIWFCLATFIGGGLIVPAAHWHIHSTGCLSHPAESVDKQHACTHHHPTSAHSEVPEQPADSDHSDRDCLVCELIGASAQLSEPVGLTSASERPVLLDFLRQAQAIGEQLRTPPMRGPPALS